MIFDSQMLKMNILKGRNDNDILVLGENGPILHAL